MENGLEGKRITRNRIKDVCYFVLLIRGWGRLETRPPVALGSSPDTLLLEIQRTAASAFSFFHSFFILDGRWGKKGGKKSFLFGTNPKARAGWPTRLRLIRATPRADFSVITAQLWSTMTAIFSWVKNLASNYYLRPRSWDYCQIFETSYLFLFPCALSEMIWEACISEYLHKD